MNENLDLVKVLKDCPSGTKLYSKCFGTVEFNKVIQNRYIEIVDNSGYFILYRCNGKLKQSSQDAEIDLFPSKDQYDWSKWQRPFVDGDVIMWGVDQFAIFKEYIKHPECHTLIRYYVYYDAENDHLDTNNGQSYIRIQRLATEEETQELFDAIKSHGYKWNSETKTLENLIKSKEDIEDKTVMSGIYFDREYYADEVELHLNNYEIEIRDGKTYAIFKNQETKISKPKFKEGDIVISAFGDIHLLRTEDSSYCAYRHKRKNKLDNIITTNITVVRLATEEEKEKLFKAIKDNGYEWDVETKTLKKLIVPKFKSGDMIVKKDDPTKSWYVQGIETYYSDHYCIITKGMFDNLYFKDQDEWELLVTIPKFKVGDKIKHRLTGDVYKILFVQSNEYGGGVYDVAITNEIGKSIDVKDQDDYELVPNKFDISTLIPYESKVLIRSTIGSYWQPAFWGAYIIDTSDGLHHHDYLTTRGFTPYCIPYDGNEHLIGKTDDCCDFYKTWEE